MKMPHLLMALGLLAMAMVRPLYAAGPAAESGKAADPVTLAMRRIGLARADWQTLVISAVRETALSRQALWSTWARVPDWPQWSGLHRQADWLGRPGWAAGARFGQVLKLGFPLGDVSFLETVGAVQDGRMASWWRRGGDIAACQTWLFEDLADGGTRITTVWIAHGAPVGLFKPLVARRWQTLTETSLDGLIHRAQAAARQERLQSISYPWSFGSADNPF